MRPGPLTSYLHREVLNRIPADATTILDMGGTGTTTQLCDARVTDANLKAGVDACALPFVDKAFDATISVATLEHVRDHDAFLRESVRVSRGLAVHWFPFGPAAQACERRKAEVPGYSHPCVLPEMRCLWPYLMRGARLDPVLTIREYMLLLMVQYPQFDDPNTWRFIDRWGPQPYGYSLTIGGEP